MEFVIRARAAQIEDCAAQGWFYGKIRKPTFGADPGALEIAIDLSWADMERAVGTLLKAGEWRPSYQEYFINRVRVYRDKELACFAAQTVERIGYSELTEVWCLSHYGGYHRLTGPARTVRNIDVSNSSFESWFLNTHNVSNFADLINADETTILQFVKEFRSNSSWIKFEYDVIDIVEILCQGGAAFASEEFLQNLRMMEI